MSENPPQPPIDPRDARAQAKAAKAYAKARRPWYKKKRFIIPIILIVLIIIISIATANGGNDDTSNDTSGSGEPGSTGQTSEPPAFPGAQESDVVGQAGAALVLEDITVTSTPLVAGDSTFGSTLCTTATVQNNSEDTIDFNALDWKLQAPSGTIQNTSLTGSSDTLTAGQVAPGGTATGDVCFENEPAETGQFIVLYEPVFSFFSDRGAWINNL